MARSKILNGLIVSILTSSVGIIQSVHATLALPDSPLFLGSQPQPNIMFAVDDSGSMAWEILLSDGVLADHPGAPNSNNLDISPNDAAEDREFCPGYNVLAYNPNVTYDPWAGVDDAGDPYTDAVITAVRTVPYSSSGTTINLLNVTGGLSAIYGIYTDLDFDDIYDVGECPTPPPDNSSHASRNYTDPRWIRVSSLSAAEQTNFANWYQYYRKREHVLKKALSEIVTDSGDRMGLATLHDNDSVGVPIKDMRINSNKEDLLEKINEIRSSGSTPLRRTLYNVGQYFDDTDGAGAPSQLGFTDSSPILPQADGGACQQNFAVLMSDGFWNNSFNSVGNEDADGTGNDTEWDGGPHADTYTATLADVAMAFYEKDLSALDDLVPEVENLDSNTTQHMVTYTVAFGLTGSGVADPVDHESTTPPPPWPQPVSDTLTTLDDMQHAAFNARGLFLNAANPQQLIDSFSAAIADIATRTTFTATAVAINSTVLRTSARLFTALFNSVDWSGEIRSFTLNDDGTLDAEQWEAGSILDATSNADRLNVNLRKMFTIVDKGATPTPIEFSNADTDLVAAITGGAATIDYIRGDQTNEVQNGGTLRDRNSILADIIKSSPVSSGAENFFYDSLDNLAEGGADHGGGVTYLNYLSTKESLYTDVNGRFSVVYVGTNGGMLHAFDSRDGSELFAYVPEAVHGNLNELTDPNYGHKHFVNASGFAGDAYINTGAGNAWHTLYVSGLGEGGKAIFALDITDPVTSPSVNNVLWEKNSTDTGYSEMGHMTFRPRVVFLNNGGWGIITGNGWNSNLERAQLFIINAVDGSIIEVIDTEEDGSGNADLPTNGLGEPFLLDEDGNRTVDWVYAGDLQGNIWKFDLRSSNTNSWNVEFSKMGNPAPLYSAIDSNGKSQPITTRPVLATHPDGGFMVMFGTGKYLEPSDNSIPASPDVQTFYGIWDDGDVVATGRTDLQVQTILEEVDINDANGNFANRARIVSDTTVDYSQDDGWYIELLTPAVAPAVTPTAEGEMVIADPLTRFGRAIFTTFIPGDTPCDRGGQSVIMELDAVNGSRLQNSVFDFNNDGVIDANDLIAYGGTSVPGSGIFIPATLASPAVISAADASAEYKQSSGLNTEVTTTMESTGGLTVGRQSWRQTR